MVQNICNSISNYFQRILNLCKCNQQKTEDVPIEEIVTTRQSKEENLPDTVQTQEIREETITVDPKVIIETAQNENIPKKTYSEVLKQAPNIKQQTNKTGPKNPNETNKGHNPRTQSQQDGFNTRQGRNPNKNIRNQSHAQAQGREWNSNRGGNRGGRGNNNRSRGRNRRGAGAARGQHTNINSSFENRRYDDRPRGNNERRPNRGYRGNRGRGGFVHGGINKSNNFQSSGIFSYSNVFSKTKDENNNKGLGGTYKGQPVVFNYYIIKNYVRKDDGTEDEVTSEIIQAGSSKHFL